MLQITDTLLKCASCHMVHWRVRNAVLEMESAVSPIVLIAQAVVLILKSALLLLVPVLAQRCSSLSVNMAIDPFYLPKSSVQCMA